MIIETNDSELIHDKLMRAFSSKPSNKHAIDITALRHPQNAIRYIDTQIDRTGKLDPQKKKYGFFKLENYGLGKNI